MRRRRPGTLWLAAALLGALAPPRATAAAATKFDGTYEGLLIGQAAAGAGRPTGKDVCTDRIARTISIAAGTLTLLYNPESNIVITGVVDENGVFAAEAVRKNVASTGYEWTLKMSGSIVDDYLTGEIYARTCRYRVQMRKSS
jgi:hypothetical protein